eukprot:350951-Chlamydomonas_euryale.AAC.11
MQCCGTRNTNGGSRSASPSRTVRTVRNVLRIRTYSTPETPSTHVPCNPDYNEGSAGNCWFPATDAATNNAAAAAIAAKVYRCGPVSMLARCLRLWGGSQSPAAVLAKVKHFFTYYAINRHKTTVLTPSYHAENYSPDDNRWGGFSDEMCLLLPLPLLPLLLFATAAARAAAAATAAAAVIAAAAAAELTFVYPCYLLRSHRLCTAQLEPTSLKPAHKFFLLFMPWTIS